MENYFDKFQNDESRNISQVFSSGLIYIVYQQGGKLVFLLLPEVGCLRESLEVPKGSQATCSV